MRISPATVFKCSGISQSTYTLSSYIIFPSFIFDERNTNVPFSSVKLAGEYVRPMIAVPMFLS